MDSLLRKKRKKILRILNEHGATDVRVFGSRARGQARPDSDIDILVDQLGADPWGVSIKLELEDAIGCSVDLVEERLLNRYRRDRIIREAVPLEPRVKKELREDINHVAADMPDDWARLRDIRDAALRVERWAASGKQAFIEDEMRQAAIVRQLEIIGEAVKKLSPECRLQYSGIPWRGYAGQRDVLIHDYPNVNLEKVWSAVTEELPLLKRQVDQMLAQMEAGKEGLP